MERGAPIDLAQERIDDIGIKLGGATFGDDLDRVPTSCNAAASRSSRQRSGLQPSSRAMSTL
jgi:hypothetical protein